MAQIKNPYIAYYDNGMMTGGWKVLYRHIIAGKINFSHICSCDGQHAKSNARRIAKLLNDGIFDEPVKIN